MSAGAKRGNDAPVVGPSGNRIAASNSDSAGGDEDATVNRGVEFVVLVELTIANEDKDIIDNRVGRVGHRENFGVRREVIGNRGLGVVEIEFVKDRGVAKHRRFVFHVEATELILDGGFNEVWILVFGDVGGVAAGGQDKAKGDRCGKKLGS